MIITENINKRIRQAFEALNIKQVEFAKRIGVSQAFVSKMFKENSDKKPSDRTVNDICRVFRINKNWVYSGKGEMFEPESDLFQTLTDELENLDDLDKKIITNYLKLNPKQRDVFKDFLLRLSK